MRPGLVLSGRYELRTALGRGGMGEVWLAHDGRLDRPVAVKLLLIDAATDEEAAAAALARFRREGIAAARSAHPAIAVVFDTGEHDGRPYLVMEHLRGRNLRDLLRERGRLPIAQVVDYAAQTAEGLAAAHAAGVVHRDIKPSNLMVVAGDRVKICDFGIARLTEAAARVTAIGVTVGTVDYMAPEQVEAHPVDGRADLYALGCTMFHLLTGRVVFPADTVRAALLRHLSAPPPSARDLRPEIPTPLDALLRNLLAKDPEDRPPGAADVASRLRSVEEHLRAHPGGSGPGDAFSRERPDPPGHAEGTSTSPDTPSPDASSSVAGPSGKAADDGIAPPGDLLDEAEDLAMLCADPYARESLLEDIARTASRYDPARARRVAHEISDPRRRDGALLEVAKGMLARFPEEAARLVLRLRDPHRPGPDGLDWQQLDLLVEAVRTLADRDPRRARRVASSIPESALSHTVEVMVAFAEASAERGATTAARQWLEKTAERLTAGRDEIASGASPDARSMARVARLLHERDPEAARRLRARVVADAERVAAEPSAPGVDDRRDHDLWRLAEIIAEWDPVVAERIAAAVSDPWTRSLALVDVVAAVAHHDATRAVRLADRIPVPGPRARGLAAAATAMAAHDRAEAVRLLAAAERVAGTVTDDVQRADAMGAIAVAAARHDPAEAVRIAAAIPQDEHNYRGEQLSRVATELAARDVAAALRVARLLPPGDREEASVRIAEAAARRDLAGAERVARDLVDLDPWLGVFAQAAIARSVAELDPAAARRLAAAALHGARSAPGDDPFREGAAMVAVAEALLAGAGGPRRPS